MTTDETKKQLERMYEIGVQTERKRIIALAEGMEKEEGQTRPCKDVLEMNHLIGLNKGWNDFGRTLKEKIIKQ